MTILQAAVLGVIQGITEFFPISSSGHLILVPEFLGWDAHSVAFDAVVHLATLGAIAFAFLPELKRMVRGMLGNTEERRWGRLGWMLIVGTIPAGLVGLLFEDWITTTLRDPRVVAASLAVWAVALAIADRIAATRDGQDAVERTGWSQAVFVGVAQAIALIPGTSRSGITITAGLFSGMNRSTAARFSFLLGVPAIAAAGAMGLYDVASGAVDIALVPLVVGFVAALISGFVAIRLLLSLVENRGYWPFVIYRIVLACIIFMTIT